MTQHKDRVKNSVIWFVLLLAFLITGYIFYFSFWPFNLIDIYNSPYPILNENKTVKRDELLHFNANFCKYMKVPSITYTEFVDTLLFRTDVNRSATLDPGCYDINIAVNIPPKLPVGMYKYRIVADYQIHPLLRTIRVVAETEKFQVIE